MWMVPPPHETIAVKILASKFIWLIWKLFSGERKIFVLFMFLNETQKSQANDIKNLT